MRPTLQLRIGQQLTMTPQLQQAIKLLQLSTLELQQEIQEALESNPLLEMDESSNNAEEKSTTNIEDAHTSGTGDVKEANASDGSEDSAHTIDEITTTDAMD
ncbi:MAG: RNA polymerase factor sigma-54, partial [Colwellia sp.]